MQRRVLMSVAAVMALSALTVACGDDSGDDATPATSGSGGSVQTTAAGSKQYAPIPDGPIVFGVSAPLSGATAAFGLATQASFEQVTTKLFNARYPNGIAGHPVQVKVYDDASDVTKAVSVANQMVEDKVAAAITVSYNPAAGPQQLAILNKAKVPVLATQGLTEYTNTAKWPYMFNMGPSTKQTSEVTADWIKAKGFKTIGVLTDGLPSDAELLDALKAAVKRRRPTSSSIPRCRSRPARAT